MADTAVDSTTITEITAKVSVRKYDFFTNLTSTKNNVKFLGNLMLMLANVNVEANVGVLSKMKLGLCWSPFQRKTEMMLGGYN